MAEPRMRMRQKGQQFPSDNLEALLFAFGDVTPSLPATISTLDTIITDFIIEICHEAALCASYSRRAKIKVDDFKFTLRKDPKKLGRVTELLSMDKEIKRNRRAFNTAEEEVVKDVGGGGGEQGEGVTGKKRGRPKGKKGVDEEELRDEDDDGSGVDEGKSVRGVRRPKKKAKTAKSVKSEKL